MNKIRLKEPIKVTKEQLTELSTMLEVTEYRDNLFKTLSKGIITTDSEWQVTELESEGLFELSTWVDFLLTIID